MLLVEESERCQPKASHCSLWATEVWNDVRGFPETMRHSSGHAQISASVGLCPTPILKHVASEEASLLSVRTLVLSLQWPLGFEMYFTEPFLLSGSFPKCYSLLKSNILSSVWIVVTVEKSSCSGQGKKSLCKSRKSQVTSQKQGHLQVGACWALSMRRGHACERPGTSEFWTSNIPDI